MNCIRRTVIITITGNSGTGKSRWAAHIREKSVALGYRVHVSDYELFLPQKDYQKRYEEKVQEIKDEGFDVGVIVVGAGSTNPPLFSIQIEPPYNAPNEVFELITNQLGGKHEK